ncbi:FxsA family protein [Candidatus Methylospira mobilis]|uniref:FxsA family protein n=1 Tax=Candidatus Methylospira mobilis TaxID=1808979 RepID=A0A5Q0BBI3_9GAMM|nr:FxsA family protein [Candidatus Methylospira mobilis]QFY41285.1 FxsA family protein [Candidatus Methylospira mobilis]WNV05493.1 FxsA family protein [Candidatus Methylospira mobilis]
MNIPQLAWITLLSLPVLEVYLLIKIGSSIGFIPTIMLLVTAATIGTGLLRTQGLAIWLRVQQSLLNGELPAVELMDGFVILAGGVLLLLPGFLSDLAGLLCLLPQTRKLITEWLLKRRFEQQASSNPGNTATNSTIEGEYRREE